MIWNKNLLYQWSMIISQKVYLVNNEKKKYKIKLHVHVNHFFLQKASHTGLSFTAPILKGYYFSNKTKMVKES